MKKETKNFWTELLILLFAVYIPFYCFRDVWDSTPMWIFLIGWTILAIGRAYFNNLKPEDESTSNRNNRIGNIIGVVMIVLGLIIGLTS